MCLKEVIKMENELKIAFLIASGLTLGGCVPGVVDLADRINLDCEQNPQAVATESIDLKTGQEIQVGNYYAEVKGLGRISLSRTEMEIYDGRAYFTGSEAYGKKWYEVETGIQGNLTRVTVRHNCAKPESIDDLIKLRQGFGPGAKPSPLAYSGVRKR